MEQLPRGAETVVFSQWNSLEKEGEKQLWYKAHESHQVEDNKPSPPSSYFQNSSGIMKQSNDLLSEFELKVLNNCPREKHSGFWTSWYYCWGAWSTEKRSISIWGHPYMSWNLQSCISMVMCWICFGPLCMSNIIILEELMRQHFEDEQIQCYAANLWLGGSNNESLVQELFISKQDKVYPLLLETWGQINALIKISVSIGFQRR